MAKTKSITELVNELQNENESLQTLKKAFNQVLKTEFGLEAIEIHKALEKLKRLELKMQESSTLTGSNKEQRLSSPTNLKSSTAVPSSVLKQGQPSTIPSGGM